MVEWLNFAQLVAVYHSISTLQKPVGRASDRWPVVSAKADLAIKCAVRLLLAELGLSPNSD